MSDFRLRVFQAVARHLSFTKAAQELFVTQPAVTKHIHELEEQYEQRLLARRGNRVTLTEAGRLLLAHAEAVAASAQQLDDQLHALRDPDEAAGQLPLAGQHYPQSIRAAGHSARISAALPPTPACSSPCSTPTPSALPKPCGTGNWIWASWKAVPKAATCTTNCCYPTN